MKGFTYHFETTPQGLTLAKADLYDIQEDYAKRYEAKNKKMLRTQLQSFMLAQVLSDIEMMG